MDIKNGIELEENLFIVLAKARNSYSDAQLFEFKEKSLALNSNMFPAGTKLLNDLAAYDLATALFIGYKKKPSKEDLITQLYQDSAELINSAKDSQVKSYHQGVMRGIRGVISILGEDAPVIIDTLRELEAKL